jgi:hypothetical protein
LLHSDNKLLDGLYASKKEWRVFFSKIQQASVGADGRKRLTDCVLRIQTWRLTVNGSDKGVEKNWVVEASAKIDPGVLTQKPERRFRTRQQDWNDRQALATTLCIGL